NGYTSRGAMVWLARERALVALDSLRADIVVRGQVHQLAVVAHEDSVATATESDRVTGDGIEHRLHISRRVGHHAQDLGSRSFTRQSLVQGLLHFRIRRRLTASIEALQGRAALRTEFMVRGILVLAPGTLHAEALPAAGSAKGRNRGTRLTAPVSRGQEHGHRGDAWGRHIPATSRRECDARHVDG